MAAVASFSGFPKQTVAFLRDVAMHNDRDWFNAHKEEYETAVLAPAKAFVLAMGERLRRLSPGIQFSAGANGSIFRIYRDTRFSSDKSPYKTNLGIYFWEGRGPRLECSGYYFHLEPPTLMLGGGMYTFSRPLLERYRRTVVDPEYGPELAAIVRKITRRSDYTLGGAHYKRIPCGYDADPEAAFLLRHAGLYAGWEGPMPPELHSPEFIDFCWAKFKPMEPLHRWLTAIVSGTFEP
jgi:uncharacterized protein (TIGR02453 family)